MKKNKLLSGKWALVGGKIYDPYEDKFLKGDLLLSNGKIIELGKLEKKDSFNVIDCSKKIITSGFTDIRSHFRYPGSGYVETIDSGVDAAMAGGYTSVCLMSDNDSPMDTPEKVQNISDLSKNCRINLLPIGALSVNHQANEVCEYGYMVDAGAVAFSDTTSSVENSQFLKYALEYCGMHKVPVISYPRDNNLGSGVVNEGLISTMLGLKGIPDISESIMIFRDLMIAQMTNERIHIPLVTTRKSLEIIKEFKKNGLKVTADISPHHIFFNEEKISNYDSNAKVYPPLRSEKNRKEIVKSVKNNIITCISSDHTPCSSEDKEKDINHAPFGTISLESAFSLSYSELIRNNCDIVDVIKLFTKGPREVLNLPPEPIKVGEDASLVVINPKKTWTFEKSDIYSKSKNSIALGVELEGKIDLTICRKNAFGSI